MKILITGTTGYIAKRLALQLLEDNHELICCVRDLIEYQMKSKVFRPHGVWERLYWYMILPFHAFVFKGMINALVEKQLK